MKCCAKKKLQRFVRNNKELAFSITTIESRRDQGSAIQFNCFLFLVHVFSLLLPMLSISRIIQILFSLSPRTAVLHGFDPKCTYFGVFFSSYSWKQPFWLTLSIDLDTRWKIECSVNIILISVYFAFARRTQWTVNKAFFQLVYINHSLISFSTFSPQFHTLH
jgi:hypothetical protein